MAVDEQRIREVVGNVMRRFNEETGHATGGAATVATPGTPVAALTPAAPGRASTTGSDDGVFDEMDAAIESASRAQKILSGMSLDERDKLIAAMRGVVLQNVREISSFALEETGMGRLEDKITKNLLVANKTPGIEDLRPSAWTGDRGLMLLEYAPFGMIGAITPSTNPTSTIICNGIGMITAGNSVVFNSHPGAKNCSAYMVQLLNRAIVGAGGPPNLIVATREPTIESAKLLMTHPGIDLLVVTGGPAVVAEAMKCSKKAICAGAGNPPVIVDETADIEQAGRDIVLGGAFDNNVVCVLEKEVIAVDSIADDLKRSMLRNGCHELSQHEWKRLQKLIFTEIKPAPEESIVNKNYVGKTPEAILREIGVTVGADVKLILVDVPNDDPLVWSEQLMPVMPLTRVGSADEAISFAVQVERGLKHTAIMHSNHLKRLTRMAREIDACIFVKNGPSYSGLGSGGEGFASFTIASPTGEGVTRARSFSRIRRCTVVDSFRIT